MLPSQTPVLPAVLLLAATVDPRLDEPLGLLAEIGARDTTYGHPGPNLADLPKSLNPALAVTDLPRGPTDAQIAVVGRHLRRVLYETGGGSRAGPVNTGVGPARKAATSHRFLASWATTIRGRLGREMIAGFEMKGGPSHEIATGKHTVRIACPECHDDQTLTRVSSLTQSAHDLRSAVGTSVSVRELMPPTKPPPPWDEVFPVVGLVGLLPVTVLIVIVANAVVNPALPAWSLEGPGVNLITSLILPVTLVWTCLAMIFVRYMAASDRRHSRLTQDYEAAYDRWSSSYYCSQHDLAISPKHGVIVPVRDLNFVRWCTSGDVESDRTPQINSNPPKSRPTWRGP
jgi:hypothetical protein